MIERHFPFWFRIWSFCFIDMLTQRPLTTFKKIFSNDTILLFPLYQLVFSVAKTFFNPPQIIHWEFKYLSFILYLCSVTQIGESFTPGIFRVHLTSPFKGWEFSAHTGIRTRFSSVELKRWRPSKSKVLTTDQAAHCQGSIPRKSTKSPERWPAMFSTRLNHRQMGMVLAGMVIHAWHMCVDHSQTQPSDDDLTFIIIINTQSLDKPFFQKIRSVFLKFGLFVKYRFLPKGTPENLKSHSTRQECFFSRLHYAVGISILCSFQAEWVEIRLEAILCNFVYWCAATHHTSTRSLFRKSQSTRPTMQACRDVFLHLSSHHRRRQNRPYLQSPGFEDSALCSRSTCTPSTQRWRDRMTAPIQMRDMSRVWNSLRIWNLGHLVHLAATWTILHVCPIVPMIPNSFNAEEFFRTSRIINA